MARRKASTNFIDRTVDEHVSLIVMDEHKSYCHFPQYGYKHRSVNHSEGEYVFETVICSIPTQNLDSLFWALLKRGSLGTCYRVCKDFVSLYLNKFSFRHNQRKHPDMFGVVVAGCRGFPSCRK